MLKHPPGSHRSPSVSDDAHGRMSDVAMRKKKNADAQAAFRARRANYIASLEETVTSLEAVVLQLQDSCKEARAEAAEIKQANARLRHAGEEREKFWRARWASTVGPHDLPPLPSAFFHGQQPSQQTGQSELGQPTATAPSLTQPMSTDARYAAAAAQAGPSTAYVGAFHPVATYAGAGGYGVQNGALSMDAKPIVPQSASAQGTHMHKYGHGAYNPYALSAAARDGWQQQAIPGTTGTGVANEDQKLPITALDAAYSFAPQGGSNSPTLSAPSTPTSSSAGSVASPYQFTAHAQGYVDQAGTSAQADFRYRRQANAAAGDMTLHAGTADISSLAGSSRYTLPNSRSGSGGSGSAGDRPASDPRRQPTANTSNNNHTGATNAAGSSPEGSRSPTPGDPPMSGTLAVIKAQAFGALRRNRARTKRSAEAARVAMEALEARGVNMGVGVKRQRLNSDDEDRD